MQLVNTAAVAALQPTIGTYQFPPGMVARLSREQGWDEHTTTLMLGEYRRFVMLSSLGAVSPSGPVDQVWHTHLLYTEDYWNRFVPLLGKPLHHRPHGAWPDDQAPVGQPGSDVPASYAETLEWYESAFGVPAPEQAWPQPATRPQAPSRSAQLVKLVTAGLVIVTLTLLTLFAFSEQGRMSGPAVLLASALSAAALLAWLHFLRLRP